MNLLFATAGWRRKGLAFLLGACATAALPPFFLTPLLIPAFSGLFLLTLNAHTAKQSFRDGWWWGLGYFTSGLYWICISLYVEPEKFAWLTPFALFGLPSIVAIYIGLTTFSLYKIARTKDPERLHPCTPFLLLPTLWIGAEYLRAHLFTGFPWNLTGYAWNMSDVTLQTASVWGIYGQSWLAVFLAILPVLYVIPTRHAKILGISGIMLFTCVVLFGSVRLATHPTAYTTTKLRIVQGNIAQSLKFSPKTALQGLKKLVDLTRSENLDSIAMVIWPETAVPYLISPDSPLTRDLGSILPKHTLLFTGGMRAAGKGADWQAWNSAFVINASGDIIAGYDKHHLVPFGEYVPLRHVLPVEAVAADMGDFSRGPGPATLSPANILPFSPLICYEAIFSDETTDRTGKAEWLANITNDAWFGTSTGPFQHLEMARTRAVEEGLPLIRAANTGISLVTDAYGRVLQRLDLNTAGIVDTLLPKKEAKKTILSRYKNYEILVLIFLCTLLLLFHSKSRPNTGILVE